MKNTSWNVQPGAPYRVISKVYNSKNYIKDISDPYNPGTAGVCSFFIPGLGQILDAEVARGLLILAAEAALGVATYVAVENVYPGESIFFGVSALALDIWAIADAVIIAKKKNMYNQDLRRLYAVGNYDIKLAPSFAFVPNTEGLTPSAGLSLKVAF